MIIKEGSLPTKFEIKDFMQSFHVNFSNPLGRGHDANVFQVYNTKSQ